jgi:ATP-dependent helicase HrpA
MMNPRDLPVYKQKDKILDQLSKNQVIVVESPTGSGKTTQIPQLLLEAGFAEKGMIGITQPRRIAAVSVAGFIARQLGKTIPDTVGYKMRFEDKTDLSTKIKIMTDGILLQEIKADYSLSRYSVLIVDEAHERSLNIDFIIGLVKRIIELRKEFKVIISSATINAQAFSEYFDECPIVNIDCPMYPVDVRYKPPAVPNDLALLIAKITETVSEIERHAEPGDILIFLSGEREIKACISSLLGTPFYSHLAILPLYSRLSSEEQEKVFDDFPGKRKVVVATNIAETSITIDGIIHVIDAGLAKVNFYNPKTFTSSLIEVPISKASSNQRKGRAGRTRPGVCYRLYSQKDFESRELFTLEEIFRTDLSEVVLRMAELGITDFEHFDFLSQPSEQGIASAVETLNLLESIDDDRHLTEIGKMMAAFPMLPRHSRSIVEAIRRYPKVIEEVLIATSFLTASSPYLLPQGEEMEARKAHHTFRDPGGDFISYLMLYRAFVRSTDKEQFATRYYLDLKTLLEIKNVKEQLEEITSELGVPISSGGRLEDYIKSVSKGLIQFVCRRTGNGIYRSLTEEKICIHPSSVMYQKSPRYIVAGEIVRTTRMYARTVSELEPGWLPEISNALVSLLSRKEVGTRHQKEAKRDFTNNIRIGSEIFRIEKARGKKKIVILPWEKLGPIVETLEKVHLAQYKGLRATIIYGNMEVFSGMALSALLSVIGKINLDSAFVKHWPEARFNFASHSHELIDNLRYILAIARKEKKSKKAGFLALSTDSKGLYWFKWMRGFQAAWSESLASLESLADEPGEPARKEDLERVNEAYRVLSTLF